MFLAWVIMTRLRILSSDDFDKLYKIPIFLAEERKNVFILDTNDYNHLNKLSSIEAKINLILQLGYFRISQYFFTFTFCTVQEDIEFILSTYFPKYTIKSKLPKCSNRQHYLNRTFILEKFQIKSYSTQFENELSKYLKSLVKQSAVPKYLFDSIINYCYQKKVVRPSYTKIQTLISDACHNEKVRMNNKLYTLLDSKLRQSLNELLSKDHLFYQLTLIKKDQKDFSTSEIRTTVDKYKLLASIYHNSIIVLTGVVA